mmetsp:Transcript_31755/g.48706  ORF Transcript_31755/g.48706 Transcript_31755/m.48706 type:complete len:80 (+) Transcript_31755:2074-2313(+)
MFKGDTNSTGHQKNEDSADESFDFQEEEVKPSPLHNGNFIILENPNESQGSSKMVGTSRSKEFDASSYPNLIRGQSNID